MNAIFVRGEKGNLMLCLWVAILANVFDTPPSDHEVIRYCSLIYVLCVSSDFLTFTKANLVLENFNKNLGFGQTPAPPCWAKSPSFSEKLF